jgi:Na+/melibiose symporter-like transporter
MTWNADRNWALHPSHVYEENVKDLVWYCAECSRRWKGYFILMMPMMLQILPSGTVLVFEAIAALMTQNPQKP